MLRIWSRIVVALLVCTLFGGLATAENDVRKVKNRVEPAYPELARQSHIEGTVKIQVVVGPGGEVKTTKPLGGNPVLVQSAETAVRKWRYEPGPEATVVVEFHFHDN